MAAAAHTAHGNGPVQSKAVERVAKELCLPLCEPHQCPAHTERTPFPPVHNFFLLGLHLSIEPQVSSRATARIKE